MNETLTNLLNEACNFLDEKKSMGKEVMDMLKSLKERKEKLLDLDIIENTETSRNHFDQQVKLLMTCDQNLQALQQSLNLKLISTTSQEESEPIERLMKEVDTQLNQTNSITQSLGIIN